MGVECLYGNYVERNNSEAVRWLLLAAEHGDGFAMRYIGTMYLQEVYFLRDVDRGKYWLKSAVKAGDKEAEEMLNNIEEHIILN